MLLLTSAFIIHNHSHHYWLKETHRLALLYLWNR